MSARILVVDDSPTIRKVVQSILRSADFDSVVATDGQDALEVLARTEVDLVLVDFVMPRMNGYQFCQALRGDPRWSQLPVVLMSAKSDRIRGHFAKQTGALDAITKPFDARGLIAVVEGALKKAQSLPEEVPDSFVEEAPDSEQPASVDVPSRPSLVANLFAEEVASVLQGALKSSRIPERHWEELIHSVRDGMGVEGLRRLLKTAELTRDDHGVALAGDLEFFSIAEVLQMLQLQRQTGTLVLRSRHRRIELEIGDGDILFAHASGLRAEFLLGRYLVEDGAIVRADLENQLHVGRTGPLGEWLVQQGLIQPEQLERALVRQTQELVYELVRWQKGHFTFSVGAHPPPQLAPAHRHSIGALVMEGFRRVDEWRLIEDTFDFEELLHRDPAAMERLEESKLTAREREMLLRVDGLHTVREILEGLEGGSFELSRILYRLVKSRLLRRAPR